MFVTGDVRLYRVYKLDLLLDMIGPERSLTFQDYYDEAHARIKVGEVKEGYMRSARASAHDHWHRLTRPVCAQSVPPGESAGQRGERLV